MLNIATFGPIVNAEMERRLREAGFPMGEARKIVATALRAKRDRR
jgi:uncharacterized protein YoaH (UPF0181 family)